MPRSTEGRAALTVLIAWITLHLLFSNRFLYHDSWIHNFPLIYHAALNGSCGVLPAWLFGVDSGYPLIIQAISTSITQLVRLPALFAMGCLELSVLPAIYVQKAQVLLTYLALAAGMYLLGRVLYSTRAAAVYLFAITLFAGLCLQTAHSDQTVNIVFWVPWIACAAVLYLRTADRTKAAKYVNAAALFFCLQALDQYPHFALLAGAVAAVLLICLRPDALRGWKISTLALLWPAILFAGLAAMQLWLVRESIVDYRPSLRADLVVDPGKFGETGFAQPTAIIGAFFPLAFMSAFDQLATALRTWFALRGLYDGASWFMYRLDSFFFYVGILPLFTAVAFLMRQGYRTQKAGWTAFAAVMLLVSLQQSGIYLALFHLPFFDVFRSYGLYLCYFVVAVLVISGFGLDALLTLPAAERRRLVRHALIVCLAVGAGAALFLAGIVAVSQAKVGLIRRLAPAGLVDLTLLVGAIWVIRRALDETISGARLVALFIGGVVVSQAIYFAVSYGRVGISLAKALERMGITRELASQAPRKIGAVPVESTRRVCIVFAQCYLHPSDTTSLSTDLQGTFLRSREAPLYQAGLSSPVVLALSAVSHPAFWVSQEVQFYNDRPEAITRLNAQQDRIGTFLREKTQVTGDELVREPSRPAGAGVRILAVREVVRSRDAVSIAYHATEPSYVNAAITFDRHWSARVDQKAVPTAKGNLDSLVIAAPPGEHVLRLEYRTLSSDLFFYSRYAMLLLACLAMVRIVRDGRHFVVRPGNASNQGAT